MLRIHYYISAHGFGHATRAIEVINCIPSSIEVEIITAVPRWLFDASLHRPFDFRSLMHDSGIMQIDCLQNDVEKTFQFWTRLLNEYPCLIQQEARWARDKNASLIVGDISPLTVGVAESAGLSSVIVANFSWDWIFRVFLAQKPEFNTVIERIAAYYRQTTLLLRTPLAGDLSVFPHIQDVPMIVRRSSLSRAEARKLLGLREEDRVVLISFGGMGLERIQPEFLSRHADLTFLTFDERLHGPENVHFLPPRETYHPDAVRASDLVLAKMGYGVVTECIAHRTPMAYPPRRDFPEQEILERESARWIPVFPISEKDFFEGNWDVLETFFTDRNRIVRAPDFFPALDGGEKTAQKLIRMI